ncbi:MAG: hypothetical protein HQM09_21885 [Candidatus Riflebacteria bacterium]|nr:hypothetical protein [Candidatus Riflebacteria bacterium]
MQTTELTFKIELLEDMHCGSGLGKLGIIDDLHARDSRGRPVVWNTTLAGLLRDRAEELCRLGYPEATRDRIVRLFGREGMEGQGRVICRSLHFERGRNMSAEAPVFHDLVSTSRETLSRRPLDATLRRIEVASAGQVADGIIRLTGDKDEELIILCLKRLEHIGGGKTRGLGRVRIDGGIRSRVVAGDGKSSSKVTGTRLRLLCKTLEPVCIPESSFAGNSIETRSFLPGQTLRGAFLTALNQFDPTYADSFAGDTEIRFCNGYFLPDHFSGDLEKVEIIPVPLTAQAKKATTSGKTKKEYPWWAEEQHRQKWEPDENGTMIDSLLKKPPQDADFKRIKSDDYLVCLNGKPFLGRPRTHTVLHNRVPMFRSGLDKDSRRPETDAMDLEKEEGALFSIASMAEDQYFCFDMNFPSAEALEKFQKSAGAWLGGNPTDRLWLRIGRGGRPVLIEKVVAPEKIASNNIRIEDLSKFCLSGELMEKKAGFWITLTSDLIIRSSQLGFVTEPGLGDLCRLAGIPGTKGSISAKHCIVESIPVHGFNTASSARRSTALAIKRGSAFLVHASVPDDLKALFEALLKIASSGIGIGERTEEGFGRFAINHFFHKNEKSGDAGEISRTRKIVSNEMKHDNEKRRLEVKNEVLGKVLEKADVLSKFVKREFPSRSQWQAFRHEMEVVEETPESIDKIFDRLETNSAKLSGSTWKEKLANSDDNVLTSLKKWRSIFSPGSDKPRKERLFFIHLSRWMAIKLDDSRRESQG